MHPRALPMLESTLFITPHRKIFCWSSSGRWNFNSQIFFRHKWIWIHEIKYDNNSLIPQQPDQNVSIRNDDHVHFFSKPNLFNGWLAIASALFYNFIKQNCKKNWVAASNHQASVYRFVSVRIIYRNFQGWVLKKKHANLWL